MNQKTTIQIKKFRFDEYIARFSGETEKQLVDDLKDAMSIKSRMFYNYRTAITSDSISIGVDKLAAAAQVFTHYLGETITINDLINH